MTSNNPQSAESVLREALASRDILCSHCGHNLRDNTTDCCPECGSQLRVVIEADRLTRRAWIPAAALTFMAFASAASAARHITLLIDLLSKFTVSFTRGAASPGKATAYLPWYWWIDLSVAIGVAIGATLGAVLAWRAFRRGDRAGLVRAIWRCVAVGVILSIQVLATALPYLLQRVL